MEAALRDGLRPIFLIPIEKKHEMLGGRRKPSGSLSNVFTMLLAKASRPAASGLLIYSRYSRGIGFQLVNFARFESLGLL